MEANLNHQKNKSKKFKKKVEEPSKLCSHNNDKVNKLYFYSSNNTCGDSLFIREIEAVDSGKFTFKKRKLVTILNFKQFHRHFVFVEEGQYERKKVLKNYIDVNVCIDMECGDTRNE